MSGGGRPEEDFASREEAIEQCVSVLMSIARDAFNLCARTFLQPRQSTGISAAAAE
jgi:hypothetical protein